MRAVVERLEELGATSVEEVDGIVGIGGPLVHHRHADDAGSARTGDAFPGQEGQDGLGVARVGRVLEQASGVAQHLGDGDRLEVVAVPGQKLRAARGNVGRRRRPALTSTATISLASLSLPFRSTALT